MSDENSAGPVEKVSGRGLAYVLTMVCIGVIVSLGALYIERHMPGKGADEVPSDPTLIEEFHRSFAVADACRKSGRVAFMTTLHWRFSVICLDPVSEDDDTLPPVGR